MLLHTVQLKGNLISTCILQLENSRVKITSCIQYLNGRPLRSYACPDQANCQACVPANVPLILNKLFNENWLCIHNELRNIVSVCSNQSLNWFSYWKTAHMQLHAVSHSYCLVCYQLVWKMNPLLAIESLLISSRLACQLVGRQ